MNPDKKTVTCNKCHKNYKFYGNTTNLKEHLKRIHPFIELRDGLVEPLHNSESSLFRQPNHYKSEADNSG